MDVLKHLRQKNFQAAHPLPTRDGAYLFPVNAPEGVRYIALFTLAPGPEISYEVDPDQVATSYGQTVAEMHNALDDFYSPHPRFQLDLDYFTKQPLQYIEPFLRDRPEDWLYVKNFAIKLRQCLLDLPANQLELGFCHGDLQGYHANVSPDGTLTAGGIRLDTMFVDEGFGSLDEESLDQAMRALHGLAEGNRLVGIISHVPELKQKIDKQIVVKKDRAKGSRVEIIY